ncbi:hypothetical protein Hanom_Chr06g00537771 [Helianthus anomalus]
MRVFEIWTKMATKCKPQGPRFKKFEIWTKMAKLPKPQGPKWQFTLSFSLSIYIYTSRKPARCCGSDNLHCDIGYC